MNMRTHLLLCIIVFLTQGRRDMPQGRYFAFIFLICWHSTGYSQRETVFDEVVTLYNEIVYDIPEVPSWCLRLDMGGELVTAGGIQLYAETQGEGIPLVLLHGGPGATHHYFHPYFSRAAEFSQVIYYDQRGCGLSDYHRGKGYTIQQAVDDLENLRIALELDKWVVLGHSYGGLLAQLYAVTYPDNLIGLVLVNSATSLNTELERTSQYDFFSEKEATRIRDIYNMTDLSLAQSVYNRHLNGDWKRQSYYRPSLEQMAELVLYECVHAPVFGSRIMRSAAQLDFNETFQDFGIPTLIIEGRWDLTWNTDKPGVLHGQHPNAELIILENSGHNPFEDEPDVFFRELERFTGML